jgi:hypothetical protein
MRRVYSLSATKGKNTSTDDIPAGIPLEVSIDLARTLIAYRGRQIRSLRQRFARARRTWRLALELARREAEAREVSSRVHRHHHNG